MIDAVPVGTGPVRPNLTAGPLVNLSRTHEPYGRSPCAPDPLMRYTSPVSNPRNVGIRTRGMRYVGRKNEVFISEMRAFRTTEQERARDER